LCYSIDQGVKEEKIDDEVEKTLKDIDLSTKSNTRAEKLSGGQKRKLSIGIALIGDPKVNISNDTNFCIFSYL